MQTKQSEKIANDLDLDIFRILSRVEGLIDADQGRLKLWHEVASRLRQARGVVRKMMNSADLAATRS